MSHRHWWLPVAAEAELAALAPGAALVMRLFGEDLVLWRPAGGAAQVFLDRCPHRGARLSLGRVVGAELECPYHGWRFDAQGQCRAIPALPDFTPPAGHRACRRHVQTAHGLLWVGGDEALSQAPYLPPALPPDPGEGVPLLPPRHVLCGPYDVATSAPRVVENFLDTAHFGFVHEGWLGERGHAAVPQYELVTDSHGRPGVRNYPAWQPRAQASAEAGAWVHYDYQVLGPYAALLRKRPEGGKAEAYALWACPRDEEHTRVWFSLFTDDAEAPAATLQAFQSTIFSQDQPVLESQQPRRLPISGDANAGAAAERHCAADRLSVAYRRWLAAGAIGFGTC